MSRARDNARLYSLAAPAYTDIYYLDDISQQFDGGTVRFLPKYNSSTITITNPLRLFLSINGIIQSVEDPELVWLSGISRNGFFIDSEGYIVFSEPPASGSSFEARLMPGTNTDTRLRGTFKPIDILLGV